MPLTLMDNFSLPDGELLKGARSGDELLEFLIDPTCSVSTKNVQDLA